MLNSHEEADKYDDRMPQLVSISSKKHNGQYWSSHSKSAIIEQRAPFYPCSHKGSCEDAQCRCYTERITCEKMCGCDKNCERRFRGCSCARTSRGICFERQNCDCWQLNRECDPDLCGSCGAAEVLDPMNKNDHSILHGRCGNVSLQRNVPRRTLLGHSEIAGFGLYVGEPIKRHGFIGEYKGEILATGESNRRAAVYHYRATNYLFKLNRGKRAPAAGR